MATTQPSRAIVLVDFLDQVKMVGSEALSQKGLIPAVFAYVGKGGDLSLISLHGRGNQVVSVLREHAIPSRVESRDDELVSRLGPDFESICLSSVTIQDAVDIVSGCLREQFVLLKASDLLPTGQAAGC